MLNKMCARPPCRNMYVTSCQIQPCSTSLGRSPRRLTMMADSGDGSRYVSRNITTLTMTIALIARDSGPGPKAYENSREGGRRIDAIVPRSHLRGDRRVQIGEGSCFS